MNTVIKIIKEFKTREDFKEISQWVRQGCPMSPTLFSLYFDEVVRKWRSQLKTNYFIRDIPLNALLFADDQIVLADSEENLQRAVFSLNNIAKQYNLRISTKKTKALGFKGVEHLRAKIEITNQILEQVTCFNYIGCNISYVRSEDRKLSWQNSYI
jgi:hypothetical protein